LPAETLKQLLHQAVLISKESGRIAAHPRAADARVLLKAVEFALHHNEFYSAKDAETLRRVLRLAAARVEQLKRDETPWMRKPGLTVRGYVSRIDGSLQPYGLEIPEGYDFDKPSPLYVWLHGRGDKTTDLHFIHQRLTRGGRIRPAGAIVLHPFGRHCMGFKSAGEIDVLDAVAEVRRDYKIDPDRIVLMGFSMGGAGAWHVGAHYADRWVAISPGAGFAETARYNRLQPNQYPAWYVQRLWSLYDVPRYTRNLFNVPVVVYSGELDKQIQAARVMEEAYMEHNRRLPHIIGPGMGHKYHPDSLREVMRRMSEAVAQGRDTTPRKVHLQTRTLRYNRVHWVEALGLEEHWRDARIDAEVIPVGSEVVSEDKGDSDDADKDELAKKKTTRPQLSLKTANVTALRVAPPDADFRKWELRVNGKLVAAPDGESPLTAATLRRAGDTWRFEAVGDELAKRPRRQGPIDDAFLDPFLVVTPTGEERNSRVAQWVEFELAHFRARWKALYRGDVRIKKDVDVTAEDVRKYHLILWGSPSSNKWIQMVLAAEKPHSVPLEWTDDEIRLRGRAAHSSATSVPLLIYPNPLQPDKYVVLNSGPTHREGHDRTNSLQNPKLPDWAIVDVAQQPDDRTPGRIADAGFFDESWSVTR
jgi:dienelactone hydrolase